MKISQVNSSQNQSVRSNQPNFKASLQAGKNKLIPGHIIGVVDVESFAGGVYLAIRHAIQERVNVFVVMVKSKKAGQDLLAELSSKIDRAADPKNTGVVDISEILEDHGIKDL